MGRRLGRSIKSERKTKAWARGTESRVGLAGRPTATCQLLPCPKKGKVRGEGGGAFPAQLGAPSPRSPAAALRPAAAPCATPTALRARCPLPPSRAPDDASGRGSSGVEGRPPLCPLLAGGGDSAHPAGGACLLAASSSSPSARAGLGGGVFPGGEIHPIQPPPPHLPFYQQGFHPTSLASAAAAAAVTAAAASTASFCARAGLLSLYPSLPLLLPQFAGFNCRVSSARHGSRNPTAPPAPPSPVSLFTLAPASQLLRPGGCEGESPGHSQNWNYVTHEALWPNHLVA